MKSVTTIALSILMLLAVSCKDSKQASGQNPKQEEAVGGKMYGGVFKVNESEYIRSLFPHSIIDIYSYRIASQVYEGLFKFDQSNLEVVPALVESYTRSDDKLTYTFRLKDNVYFHDDACFPDGKGRKLTAQDVKYCFSLACLPSNANMSFYLFDGVVKGAQKFYIDHTDPASHREALARGVEGINVLDDLTLEITLTRPNSMFLYNLARPGAFIFPHEAYEKYGQHMRTKCVGTGAFTLESVDEDISIILKRNPRYYGRDEYGNQLPFLQAIQVSFVKDKKQELLMFKKGELDMMYRIPTDYIIDILAEASQQKGKGNAPAKYELQRVPEMSTQFLAFNNAAPVFKDVNVRKAFSYAVDRNRILEYVLNGEGYKEGVHGITPPAFERYNIELIKGYSLNVDSARYYLAKAGYPNGKGFPQVTLDLNTEGDQYSNVALEIKKQLEKYLNVKVDIQIHPFAQIADKSTSGQYQMIRLAWIADYPSPENYLWAYYSKSLPLDPTARSYPNIMRYSNPEFDRHYEHAMNADDTDEAFHHFLEAERVLVQDAPFLVLWYDEGYRLLQPYVKNLDNNPMQYRDFSAVFFSGKPQAM